MYQRHLSSSMTLVCTNVCASACKDLCCLSNINCWSHYSIYFEISCSSVLHLTGARAHTHTHTRTRARARTHAHALSLSLSLSFYIYIYIYIYTHCILKYMNCVLLPFAPFPVDLFLYGVGNLRSECIRQT